MSVGDAIGDPSLVEGVGTAVGDRAQRLARDRQHEPIARRPRAAARLAVRRDRGREAAPSCRSQLAVQRRAPALRDNANPSSASATAGMTTSFHGSLPNCLCASSRPRTVPGHAGREVAGRGQRLSILPSAPMYMVRVDFSGAFSR